MNDQYKQLNALSKLIIEAQDNIIEYLRKDPSYSYLKIDEYINNIEKEEPAGQTERLLNYLEIFITEEAVNPELRSALNKHQDGFSDAVEAAGSMLNLNRCPWVI